MRTQQNLSTRSRKNEERAMVGFVKEGDRKSGIKNRNVRNMNKYDDDTFTFTDLETQGRMFKRIIK